MFGLVDAPFESLAIGQPVEARPLRDVDGITLLAFRPRGAVEGPR